MYMKQNLDHLCDVDYTANCETISPDMNLYLLYGIFETMYMDPNFDNLFDVDYPSNCETILPYMNLSILYVIFENNVHGPRL